MAGLVITHLKNDDSREETIQALVRNQTFVVPGAPGTKIVAVRVQGEEAVRVGIHTEAGVASHMVDGSSVSPQLKMKREQGEDYHPDGGEMIFAISEGQHLEASLT